MINMPVKDIIAKITKVTGMSEDDVQKKIAEKINQLYGLVSEEGAAHIIANENGIKLFEITGEMKIKDVLIGMKSVDVVGKVMRKYELREFNTEKRKGKVANLMLADETGSIRVVFWNDKTNDFTQIKEEDVLKIKSAYVRDNSGRKELHLGDSSHVIINPANVTVNARERKEYAKKHISELQDGVSAEIMGTIVQVFDVKFFEVCPKCNKRLRLRDEQFACDEHGVQTPSFNYVLNAYIDDGTGNIRTIFWKVQSQRLLKIDDKEFGNIRMNQDSFEKYKTDLLGVQIKVLGTAKNNIMGRLEFNSDLVFTDLNPDHEVELLDHMREVTLETKPAYTAPSGGTGGTQTSPAQKNTTVKSGDLDDEFEVSEDFLE